ncbi:unnamed protein product [Camellia sinensis]
MLLIRAIKFHPQSVTLSLSLSMDSSKVEMFFKVFCSFCSSWSCKKSIITTQVHGQHFQKSIERDQSLGHDICFHTFKLPAAEFGSPEGCESLLATSVGMSEKILMAFTKLHEPIEQLLRERRPDCIVSDMFHPWTVDVGARLGIPRILFYVTGLFPLCCEESLRRYAPHEKNSIDGEPNSVLYVSFGSQASMAPEQFLELAHGLEASGCPFIWVARDMLEYSQEEKEKKEGGRNRGKKLLEGFEERMTKSGQGLIVKSWAPQLLILEHANIGGFLTHCGWNSTIKGIGASVPMITWPLVVTITREKVEAAIKWLIGGGGGGGEVEEMRRRVKELSEKAKKAVDHGGSSVANAIALMNELKSRRSVCVNKL